MCERWIIEEYHKCLKMGCRIEDAQPKTVKQLLALLRILGIVATQLLKLRDLSRQQPDRLAKEVVEKEIIDIVKSKIRSQRRKNLWFERKNSCCKAHREPLFMLYNLYNYLLF